jgi:hypothetical protein
LLFAQLVHSVKSALPIEINATILFSDYTIAIAWAKADVSRLKTYMGNGVQWFRELVDAHDLLYVDTANNAADVVSHGLMPVDIQNCEISFDGPTFLLIDIPEWPVESPAFDIIELPEVLPSLIAVKNVPEVCILSERVSRFRRMI